MSGRDDSPQLTRIARVLGAPASDVHGLGDVPDDDLRTLHDAISSAIFAEHEQRFARIAGLSKAIPASVAGKLAERFLPPTLGARCAELLEPAKARDLVGTVSMRYLADLTLALNPTRSGPVVRAIPARHIAPVAKELFARGEYAAMAEFAGTVTREALEAALDVADAADLLTVVPSLVWNDNIDAVIEGLSEDKIEALVRDIVATRRWDDASRLIARLNPAKADDLVGKVPLDALLALVRELDPQRLAPVARAISPDRMADLARGLFAAHEYEVIASFVDVVTPDAISAALGVASAADLLAVAELVTWTPGVAAAFDARSRTTPSMRCCARSWTASSGTAAACSSRTWTPPRASVRSDGSARYRTPPSRRCVQPPRTDSWGRLLPRCWTRQSGVVGRRHGSAFPLCH